MTQKSLEGGGKELGREWEEKKEKEEEEEEKEEEKRDIEGDADTGR